MNLVYFVDGTMNTRKGDESTCPTNVSVLEQLVQSVPGHQKKRYLPGVGAEWRGARRRLAGVSGLGTQRRITRAYATLCRDYRPGDHIYLFGFSRGALAVRSLMGFLDLVGVQLWNKELRRRVEFAYSLYLVFGASEYSPLNAWLKRWGLQARPTAEELRLPVYFVGVWDTVASLVVPGQLGAFAAKRHQTELPSNVTHARQALALHELRTFFQPVLWKSRHPKSSAKSVRQVWFTGDHSDVGGGHRDGPNGRPSDGLSSIALQWMAQEAVDCGGTLKLSPSFGHCAKPGSSPIIHQELKGPFLLTPRRVRGVLRHARRLPAATLDTMEFHPSVFDRFYESSVVSYSYRRSITRRLRAIDGLIVPLHIALIHRPQPGRPITPVPTWLAALRCEDLHGCRQSVQAFVTTLDSSTTDTERLARSIAVDILCRGVLSTDAIRRLVDETSAVYERDYTERVWQKLEIFQKWLLRRDALADLLADVPSALPERLRPETLTLEKEIREKTRTLRQWLTGEWAYTPYHPPRSDSVAPVIFRIAKKAPL